MPICDNPSLINQSETFQRAAYLAHRIFYVVSSARRGSGSYRKRSWPAVKRQESPPSLEHAICSPSDWPSRSRKSPKPVRMPSIRLQNAFGIPKRFMESTACRNIIPTRAVSSSPKNQVIRSATGGRKSGSEWNGFRHKSRLYAFDWNGVRRTSTWQYSRGQPQKSNAAGALGLLFGVSAVAVLAAPVVSWVQDQADALIIDIDDVDEGKVVEGQ